MKKNTINWRKWIVRFDQMILYIANAVRVVLVTSQLDLHQNKKISDVFGGKIVHMILVIKHCPIWLTRIWLKQIDFQSLFNSC